MSTTTALRKAAEALEEAEWHAGEDYTLTISERISDVRAMVLDLAEEAGR